MQLTAHADQEVDASHSSVIVAASHALRPTGWRFEAVAINAVTGFAKIQVRRPLEGRSVMLVTLLRSRHNATVHVVREWVVERDGMIGTWLDVCNSTLVERQRFDGIGAAMRRIGQYIDDNSAAPAIAGRSSMRILCGEARRLEP
jgi:hypothetical protein